MRSVSQCIANVYASNERAILASLRPADRRAFRLIQKRTESFYNRLRRSSMTELLRAANAARLIIVGSFHTLDKNQAFFLRLLQTIVTRKQADVAVALDFLPAAAANTLNSALKKAPSLAALAESIDWPFGDHRWLLSILELARKHKISILGTKTKTKQSVLANPDLIDFLRRHPKTHVLLYCGESKVVAPLSERQSPPFKLCIIHQNPFLKRFRTRGQQLPAVYKRTRDHFVVCHSHPVNIQQSYLYWLYDEPYYSDLSPSSVEALVHQALSELSVRLKKPHLPRLLTLETPPSQYARLKRTDRQTATLQLLRQESYTFTDLNTILIASISSNQIIEEIVHYLKYRYFDFRKPETEFESFVYEILHEALAFWVSKRITGKREPITLEAFLRHVHPSHRSQVQRLARLRPFVRHNHHLLECLTPDERYKLSHYLGYQLGNRLYQSARKADVIRNLVLSQRRPIMHLYRALRHMI